MGFFLYLFDCMICGNSRDNLALGNKFLNYLDVFKPYLTAGLGNHEEAQVCSAAIGVLADLCRALEGNIAPYLDEFMSLLFQIVQVGDPCILCILAI